jgi:hypothetical protein
VLRLLDQLTLTRDELVDGLKQFGLTLGAERKALPNPVAKVAARPRLIPYRLLDLLRAHGVVRPEGGHQLVKLPLCLLTPVLAQQNEWTSYGVRTRTSRVVHKQP